MLAAGEDTLGKDELVAKICLMLTCGRVKDNGQTDGKGPNIKDLSS